MTPKGDSPAFTLAQVLTRVVAAFPLAFAVWVLQENLRAGLLVSTMLIASFVVGRGIAGEEFIEQLATLKRELLKEFGKSGGPPP